MFQKPYRFKFSRFYPLVFDSAFWISKYQNYMAFWFLTTSFTVEWDFKKVPSSTTWQKNLKHFLLKLRNVYQIPVVCINIASKPKMKRYVINVEGHQTDGGLFVVGYCLSMYLPFISYRKSVCSISLISLKSQPRP